MKKLDLSQVGKGTLVPGKKTRVSGTAADGTHVHSPIVTARKKGGYTIMAHRGDLTEADLSVAMQAISQDLGLTGATTQTATV